MITDNIRICESVGKLKGIGKQGEAIMNDMNIHTIDDLQRYVQLYGLIKMIIQGLGQSYDNGLEDRLGKPMPFINGHRKWKIRIIRDMEIYG